MEINTKHGQNDRSMHGLHWYALKVCFEQVANPEDHEIDRVRSPTNSFMSGGDQDIQLHAYEIRPSFM